MNTVITPADTASRKNLDMRTGDTVRVWQKIQERGKTRLQAFEGIVLARKHGSEAGATFTVRRNTNGFGVEKIFPLYSPFIDKIEVVKRSKTRRSKLYYIRDKALKEMRKRFKMMSIKLSTEDNKEEVSETANQDETTVSQEESQETETAENTEFQTPEETEKK